MPSPPRASYFSHTDDELFAAPTAGVDARGVPVIDISALTRPGAVGGASAAAAAAVRDIVTACEDWGFFQVVGHGVPPDLHDEFHAEMRRFFYADRAVKSRIKRTKENSRGWADDELTKQRLDWKELYDLGAQDGSLDAAGLDGCNQWPAAAALPRFEPTLRRWFDACRRLSQLLLEAMTVGLGLPPSHFTGEFAQHTSYLRMNYYPTCPDPSAHAAISHHTDAGALTVLTQTDVKSLQVFRPSTGMWYDVEPLRGAFVINTGDVMQVWSNDRYRAPLHRVKAQKDMERWSAPFFYNPNYATNYRPAEPLLSAANPPRYRPINWGEFRMKRFAGDYADAGEETQIAHYKIPAPAASRL